MNQSELKKEWLAGNSVVALGGALLLAQSWRLSGGVIQLPFGRTIPDLFDVVYIAIVSFLLASSVMLGLASMLPILRNWALRMAEPFAPALGFFVWVSFVLSLLPEEELAAWEGRPPRTPRCPTSSYGRKRCRPAAR